MQELYVERHYIVSTLFIFYSGGFQPFWACRPEGRRAAPKLVHGATHTGAALVAPFAHTVYEWPCTHTHIHSGPVCTCANGLCNPPGVAAPFVHAEMGRGHLPHASSPVRAHAHVQMGPQPLAWVGGNARPRVCMAHWPRAQDPEVRDPCSIQLYPILRFCLCNFLGIHYTLFHTLYFSKLIFFFLFNSHSFPFL